MSERKYLYCHYYLKRNFRNFLTYLHFTLYWRNQYYKKKSFKFREFFSSLRFPEFKSILYISEVENWVVYTLAGSFSLFNSKKKKSNFKFLSRKCYRFKWGGSKIFHLNIKLTISDIKYWWYASSKFGKSVRFLWNCFFVFLFFFFIYFASENHIYF